VDAWKLHIFIQILLLTIRYKLSEDVEKLTKRNLIVTQNTDYFVLLQVFSLVLYYFVSHSMFHLHICKEIPHFHSFVKAVKFYIRELTVL